MYHQPNMQIFPVGYESPLLESIGPRFQTVLFGCPLELQTDGKIPPVLEYLFDSFPSHHHPPVIYYSSVGQCIETVPTNSLYWNT